MRRAYLVTYDVCDAKRLRQVFKTMRAHGDHLQYSVFRCELNRSELVLLRDTLDEIIHHEEDQVLFIDLGPITGRGTTCIEALGKKYTPLDRCVVVI